MRIHLRPHWQRLMWPIHTSPSWKRWAITPEEQKQYHNTLVLLCELVPDLASSIDLETDAIIGGTDALRANTEAWKQNAIQQAYQEQLTAIYSSYADVMVEAEQNSIRLTEAKLAEEAATQKYNDAIARMDELWNEAKEMERKQKEI